LNRSLTSLNYLQSSFVESGIATSDQIATTISQAQSSLDAGVINIFDFVRVVGQSYDALRSNWQSGQLYLLNLSELNYYTE